MYGRSVDRPVLHGLCISVVPTTGVEKNLAWSVSETDEDPSLFEALFGVVLPFGSIALYWSLFDAKYFHEHSD
jgi:hypothetical protein